MNFFRYLFICFFFILTQNAFAAYTCGVGANAVLQTNMEDFPSTICADVGGNNCLVQEKYSEKTSSGWTIYALSTGDACGSLTVLNKPTLPDDGCFRDQDGSIRCPEEPTEPEPDTTLKCTIDSCPNPDNKRCPSGYTSGSFNGQRLCMKSDSPDDPNNPDNPTENEVSAIIDAKNSIVGAVQSASDSISDGLKKIYDLLKEKLTGDKENNNEPTEEPSTQYPETTGLEADLPKSDLPEQDLKDNLFVNRDSCPANKNLNMSFLGRSISYSFSFDNICSGLSIIGYFILIMCYLYAAYIVVRA